MARLTQLLVLLCTGLLGLSLVEGADPGELCKKLGIQPLVVVTPGLKNTESLPGKVCPEKFKGLLSAGVTEDVINLVINWNGVKKTSIESLYYMYDVVEVAQLLHNAITKEKADEPGKQTDFNTVAKQLLDYSSIVDLDDRPAFVAKALQFAPFSWWETFVKDEAFLFNFRLMEIAGELTQSQRFRYSFPVFHAWAKETNRKCNEQTVLAILKFDVMRHKHFESATDFKDMFGALCHLEAARSKWTSTLISDLFGRKQFLKAPLDVVKVILRYTEEYLPGFAATDQVGSSYGLALMAKELSSCGSDSKCINDTFGFLKNAALINLHPKTFRKITENNVLYDVGRQQLMNFVNDIRRSGFVFPSYTYAPDMEHVLVALFMQAESLRELAATSGQPEPASGTGLPESVRSFVTKHLAFNNVPALRTYLDSAAHIGLTLREANEFSDYAQQDDVAKLSEIVELFSKIKGTDASSLQYKTSDKLWHKLRDTRDKRQLDLLNLARLMREENAQNTLYNLMHDDTVQTCPADVLASIARYDTLNHNLLTKSDFHVLFHVACVGDVSNKVREVIDKETAAGRAVSIRDLYEKLNDLRESRGQDPLDYTINDFKNNHFLVN